MSYIVGATACTAGRDRTGQDVDGVYDKYVQCGKFYGRIYVGVLVITRGFGQSILALPGCDLLWAKRIKSRKVKIVPL